MINTNEERNLPRKKAVPAQPDRLIGELARVESELKRWIESSSANAAYFRRDPVGAMRTAGLDIDDDIMIELETVASDVARKLKGYH